MTSPTESLRSRCHVALLIQDPQLKTQAVAELYAEVQLGDIEIGHQEQIIQGTECGRPAKPDLVAPRQLKRRRLGSEAGRASLIHAVAHIEFNAINLALDACARFDGMPGEYYLDWIRVAADEARHFLMVSTRLGEIGYAYGDFPAHNGLWDMAVNTVNDCLARMALVPRVLEARGLDVTPGMMQKLEQVGDLETNKVLQVILDEEVAHVEIGTRWFHYCCELQDKEPISTFEALLKTQFSGQIRGPFNYPAREKAGFGADEMAMLEGLNP